MTNNKKIKKHSILFIMIAVIYALCIMRGYFIADKQVRSQHDFNRIISEKTMLSTLNNDWILQYADGRTQKITLPCEVSADEGEIILKRDIKDIFHQNDIIQFDNNRQEMTVMVDGQVLYEVNTTRLRNQISYTDRQLVKIPDGEHAKELTIIISHTPYSVYTIPEIVYGSYYCAENIIIRNDLYTLIVLVILSILLVGISIIYFISHLKEISNHRMLYLGSFVLMAILWGIADSYLNVLTNIPQEVWGLICYLSLMILPIPMCQFVWISCNGKYSVLKYLSIFGVIHFIFETVFSCLGIIQLEKTFFISHLFTLVVIVISLICIFKIHRERESRDVAILYMGMLILALFAASSIFLYWLKGGVSYRNCILTGILIFSADLLCYVIVHYVNKMQESQLKLSEIKIHEKLSLFDDLTGLPNRRAFEAKLIEVEKMADSLDDAILLMMDVNGLKIVNDSYGHNAGDDLIVSAAKVIQKTYGETGFCFRIGGDEFVVILLDLSISESTYDHIFYECINEINETSRWKLSIAKGSSHLTHNFGEKLSISDWKQEADVNMYRNKVQQAQESSRNREKDLTDIIRCIISTIEAKDRYTAAHSERVRELAYCIATKLGLSNSTLRNIQTAARLHDIGKIGIPDYILLKKGKLTEEEYEIIKTHSLVGANIINQAKGMYEIADIVLHHHERWDGKGYPDGLEKDQIPLEARIIALADSIDAMTSKRIYRDGMSLDYCYQSIQEYSGIMYDPAITQIVLQNWNEIKDIVLLHPKRLIDENELVSDTEN